MSDKQTLEEVKVLLTNIKCDCVGISYQCDRCSAINIINIAKRMEKTS